MGTISGSSRRLHPLAPVREGATLALQFDGKIGDRVYLAASPSADHLFIAASHGVQLFASPPRRIFLGTIGAAGTLSASPPIPSLPLGVAGSTRQLQSVALDAANETWLATSGVLVMLDSSL